MPILAKTRSPSLSVASTYLRGWRRRASSSFLPSSISRLRTLSLLKKASLSSAGFWAWAGDGAQAAKPHISAPTRSDQRMRVIKQLLVGQRAISEDRLGGKHDC